MRNLQKEQEQQADSKKTPHYKKMQETPTHKQTEGSWTQSKKQKNNNNKT